MFGLIPIYFLGKYFSELAHEHDRSRWGFGILGIVVYIGVQLLMGVIFGIILIASNPGFELSKAEEVVANVVGIGLGALSVWLFYYLLKKSWEKKRALNNTELLDSSTN